MLRRAALVGAVLAAAMAPNAVAADFFDVSAVGSAAPAAGGPVASQDMLLSVACRTTDAPSYTFYLYKCSVGPLSATVYCGFECFGLPVAAATGIAPRGQYELCVGAASFGPTSKNFHKCVPLDPITGTAVIDN